MSCGDENTAQGLLPRFAHDDDNCNDTADPMNILFLSETASNLEKTFHQITNVDKQKRWKTPSWLFVTTARDQWIDFGGTCTEQDEQCVVGWIWDRFHIRLWNVPGSGNVIANAHHENLLTIGGNLPLPRPHQPDSFDAGKGTVCDDFQALGREIVLQALPMNNGSRLPDCDGHAALIGGA